MDLHNRKEKELVAEVATTDNKSLENDQQSIEWSDADEKRIRNKMDMRIVPTVFILYILCFIDRYASY